MDRLMTTAVPFTVAGIGPGESPYRLPAVDEAARCADVLVGGERHLTLFRFLGKEEVSLAGRMGELAELLRMLGETKRVVLLVSGDPGFHSPLRMIASRFERGSYRVIPGISSFQLAAARSGRPWQEDLLLSLHGREGTGWSGLDWPGRVGQALDEGRRAILLTDKQRTPRRIAEALPAGADLVLEMYYRLGHEDERNEIIRRRDFLSRPVEEDEKETLCVMIIRRP